MDLQGFAFWFCAVRVSSIYLKNASPHCLSAPQEIISFQCGSGFSLNWGARLYPFVLFLTCDQSETGEYAIIRLFDIARIYHMTRGMDCVRNHQLAPRGASPCAVIDLMHPFNDAKYLECKNGLNFVGNGRLS